ncbi:uncharacterized protein At2g29880-like [Impatiens glandulifera]|uniref:uncharacterized protein At2g29880-like n=1 Tax=Impatiens glandulifera TaxID=253017 RepID=UPI001FB0BBA6|nr:uncharacterized protein At2g29880-like [Impatiens glandulifera]
MSSHVESVNGKVSTRTKRCWSDEEDALLIQILLELHSTGKYKADRGFKPGLFQATEREFEQRMPGCGIRADPHIYSRIKTLKTHFGTVYDMLYGSTSGFGWDPIRKCVVADKHVWDSYLQSHKNAAPFKDKSFRYFDELAIIFGVDRANGNGAVDYVRAEDDVNRGDEQLGCNLEDDFTDHISTPVSQPTTERSSPEGRKPSRKRKASKDVDLVEVLRDNTTTIVAGFENATDKICNAITDIEVRRKINYL